MQQENISIQRKRAVDGQMAQAERMVKRSRLEHVAGNPGDNVIIPIPLVDRGKGDPCNIMGVNVDRNQNDSYCIAVHAGLLKGRYSRNQFDLCNQKLYTLSDMCTDIEVGLKHAVKDESLGGGQGYAISGKRCSSNHCKCYMADLKCNRRCHSSLICLNK